MMTSKVTVIEDDNYHRSIMLTPSSTIRLEEMKAWVKEIPTLSSAEETMSKKRSQHINQAENSDNHS
ncbi:hypothetical protein ACJMK2_041033, partial [Sinanodonta woodiana]